MKEKIARLIERFPEREAIIKALGEGDARFRDVVNDHYDPHRQLNREDAAADPSTSSDLRARQRNLEEELIRLIQGYPLA